MPGTLALRRLRMENMNKEATKCRGPLAAELNKLGVWLPFPNVSYLMGTDAYKGRPDGEYRSPQGKVIDVEFKATIGSLFFGNPDDPASTEGFHGSQRSWHTAVSQRSRVPYVIALFAYESRTDRRMKAQRSWFYVVEPTDWYALEEKVKAVDLAKIKRTISVAAGAERLLAYRHLSLEECWAHLRHNTAEEAAQEIHRRCTNVH